MSLVKISKLFNFEKGSLQSSKCTAGKYTFITAAAEWKSHNDYDYECEALIFAAAASGSLGRTHYINGKFIASDLCFVLTPKNQIEYPIDLKFYHFIFTQLKNDIVRKTKAGTSKEAIGLKSFGNYELPYVDIKLQEKIKATFTDGSVIKENLITEQTHQLDIINKLRQQILKDAIQGKLVSQNINDEPASDLLKEIKEEKERLIKEKKVKKEKPLPPISENEIPFAIPMRWEWCRLGEICKQITDGEHQTPPRFSKGRMLLSAKNIRNGYIDFENIEFISEESYVKSIKRCNPEVGDILIVSVGATIGRSSILFDDKGFALVRSVALIKPLIKYINQYIKYVLDSPLLQKDIQNRSWGTAQPCLYLNQIKELMLPLPPLFEQQRIVKRVNELMNLCDKLEESIIRNQNITENLYQSALKEALQPKKSKIIKFTPRYCDVPLRAILAGYILNQCYSEDFGRVKFMKLLYLVEHICHLDFNSQYIVKAAGPYDEGLIKEIEQKLSQMRFYQIQQDQKDNKRVHYTRLGCATELDSLFNAHFVNEKEVVDGLLSKFKNSTWDQCEIIATLYAVWNNRIIKNEMRNDALLKKDFLDWDKNKAKYKDRLDAALEWMRNNDTIPTGYGKLIEKPISYAQ